MKILNRKKFSFIHVYCECFHWRAKSVSYIYIGEWSQGWRGVDCLHLNVCLQDRVRFHLPLLFVQTIVHSEDISRAILTAADEINDLDGHANRFRPGLFTASAVPLNLCLALLCSELWPTHLKNI